jgi:hypothetical protein
MIGRSCPHALAAKAKLQPNERRASRETGVSRKNTERIASF